MKKIISLFKRDMDGNRQVYDEVTPGAEWVVAGEGRATRKWDGTCCLVRDGKLYKRYTLKSGRTAPWDFEPATEVDPNTGTQQGWVPVGNGPADKWHREVWDRCPTLWEDGTYELVGPRIQGNPESLSIRMMQRHGQLLLDAAPRSFEPLRRYLAANDIEGIVWHHPDGRMVKIKGRDFGVERPTQVGAPS